jgi:hypothetical protein
LKTPFAGILLGTSSASITTAMAAVVFAPFPHYLGSGTVLLFIVAAIQRLVYIRLCQHPNAIATPLVEQFVILATLLASMGELTNPETPVSFLTVILSFLVASWVVGLSLWLWGALKLSYRAYFGLWSEYLPSWLFGGFLIGIALTILLNMTALPIKLVIASCITAVIFIGIDYLGRLIVVAPLLLASIFITPWLHDSWLLKLALHPEMGQNLGPLQWELVFSRGVFFNILSLVIITLVASYFNLSALQPPLADNTAIRQEYIDRHFRYIAVANIVSGTPCSVTAPDAIMAKRLDAVSVWIPVWGALTYLILLVGVVFTELSFPQFVLSGLMLWLAKGLISQGWRYCETRLEALASVTLGVSLVAAGFPIIIVWTFALLAYRLIQTYYLKR